MFEKGRRGQPSELVGSQRTGTGDPSSVNDTGVIALRVHDVRPQALQPGAELLGHVTGRVADHWGLLVHRVGKDGDLVAVLEKVLPVERGESSGPGPWHSVMVWSLSPSA